MRGISIDDILKIARITGIAVSPRGDIAYSITRMDPKEDKYRAELVIEYMDGWKAYLSWESISNTSWSPSGTAIAFTSRRGLKESDKGTYIYIWSGRGEPRRVAYLRHGVYQLGWVDESSIIALSRKPVEGLYDDEGDYIATDRKPIWVDGEGLTAGTKRILYIIDVDSGKTEILAEDKEDIYGFTIYERDIYYFTPIDWRKTHINKLVKQGVNRKKTVILEGYNISQVRAGPKGVYALMHKNEIGIASHYKLYALGDEETCISCGLDRNIDSIAGFRGENPVIIYKDRGSRILAEAGSEGLQVIDGDNSYIHEADAGGGVVA